MGNKTGWGNYWCASGEGAAPRGAGLWGNMCPSGEHKHIWLTRPGIRCIFTAPQTCTETYFLVLPLSKPSAVDGSCSICTTCVIREHSCSVGTSHLSCVPDWWLSLPCHVTFYSSILAHGPHCPSVTFAPYRVGSVSVHFCLAESFNSNSFIILFCKRKTSLSDAFQLSSNRSFKTM